MDQIKLRRKRFPIVIESAEPSGTNMLSDGADADFRRCACRTAVDKLWVFFFHPRPRTPASDGKRNCIMAWKFSFQIFQTGRPSAGRRPLSPLADEAV